MKVELSAPGELAHMMSICNCMNGQNFHSIASDLFALSEYIKSRKRAKGSLRRCYKITCFPPLPSGTRLHGPLVVVAAVVVQALAM